MPVFCLILNNTDMPERNLLQSIKGLPAADLTAGEDPY